MLRAVQEAAALPLETSHPRLFAWQARIFSLLWLAYASYYLCRLNFAAAQPAILAEFPDWTDAKIGLIPSVYAGVYAVGQFVNGQLIGTPGRAPHDDHRDAVRGAREPQRSRRSRPTR